MSSQGAADKRGPQGAAEPIYSEQLFGGGIYGRHHRRRFEWLRRKFVALAEADGISVLEVGCHDGRALSSIPRRVRRYAGFDAGWGGGLERGRQQFAAENNYTFTKSTDPRDVAALEEKFDFVICMETLEHLETPIVEGYIRTFAEKCDGYALFTVPNEKGIALLVKATGARVLNIERYYPYTAAEFFWGLLGRLDRIRRFRARARSGRPRLVTAEPRAGQQHGVPSHGTAGGPSRRGRSVRGRGLRSLARGRRHGRLCGWHGGDFFDLRRPWRRPRHAFSARTPLRRRPLLRAGLA